MKKTDHKTFDDIECPTLRTWNRTMVMFNIARDLSLGQAGLYLKSLSDTGKKQVEAMIEMIKTVGLEETKRQVINGDIEKRRQEAVNA